MDDVILYDRDPHYVPRVAAVHDMCGYGNCSLTAAIPILSAAGCDVCRCDRAIFGTHALQRIHLPRYDRRFWTVIWDAWRKENVDLDGVYSGFLGSAEQVAIIKRLYSQYPHALRLVDPVMGDGGEIYATYTPELCEAMSTLVDGADVLMPNLTEASILTKRTYPGRDLSDAEVNDMIDALLDLGAKNVVLKGIDHDDGTIRNYVASAASGASGQAGACAQQAAVHDAWYRRRVRFRTLWCSCGQAGR